jgi:hypothetical protein
VLVDECVAMTRDPEAPGPGALERDVKYRGNQRARRPFTWI